MHRRFANLVVATAELVQKNNIFPIPIELEKKIPPKNFSLFDMDYEEFAYNKNVKLVPDTILKKYCHLFSIDKKKIKKLKKVISNKKYGGRVIHHTPVWASL